MAAVLLRPQLKASQPTPHTRVRPGHGEQLPQRLDVQLHSADLIQLGEGPHDVPPEAGTRNQAHHDPAESLCGSSLNHRLRLTPVVFSVQPLHQLFYRTRQNDQISVECACTIDFSVGSARTTDFPARDTIAIDLPARRALLNISIKL